MPKRVFSADEPWPLHNSAHTRAIEAGALAAAPPYALMDRAGLAVARLALAVAPHAHRFAVLAGPGNNGGDGLIAAWHLHRLGKAVQVLHLADAGRLPADAAQALQKAKAAGVRVTGGGEIAADTDLLIDGLLGLGASRPPDQHLAAVIHAANATGRPMLAIDLPSGLQADTGCSLGGEAIRATWTLSLLTLKPGLFTAQGRDHAGEVWFDNLGVTADAPAQAWLSSARNPPYPGFAARLHAQHKGSFGDLTVVGGAAGMQGAALLAANAALTAGAGRVYVRLLGGSPAGLLPPELMLSAAGWLDDAAALGRNTVVCGCGGGQPVADALPRLLAHAGRLVLDADALNAIAASPALQVQLQGRAQQGAATVLTPHPLEAARLLACDTAAVQGDRLSAVMRLADRFAATVVLKGSGSVIAAPSRSPWINSSGNAALAAPGTGDVLAGWIGGLWARQPDGSADGAWFAARASAWLHGFAADRLWATRPGQASLPLRAGQLPGLMAAALG